MKIAYHFALYSDDIINEEQLKNAIASMFFDAIQQAEGHSPTEYLACQGEFDV